MVKINLRYYPLQIVYKCSLKKMCFKLDLKSSSGSERRRQSGKSLHRRGTLSLKYPANHSVLTCGVVPSVEGYTVNLYVRSHRTCSQSSAIHAKTIKSFD